ncbi:alpha/beta hydrolase fold domain-containing protein [Paracoccus sp. 1_MG-2023]|uniref:alpha/beta hydrolase fold domain-containing protein n=1 Tax=unclassified Paracoccus (in: a-proteobacteria) TaxID=2688777 RepID=UPI001C095B41|nr:MULTISPECIES: alpha/beta hydrolase fold domain-containing protein [unclassified Paracoccus (in: a-proteobacteria)]MBU2957950.1 alpha/beta hydrolase [Paracoccus sp. C2R09]MDO6668856.1 alpha/beta hydrolase fold domain-containing protein [Paracoccus sp. 1_MG-2023]
MIAIEQFKREFQSGLDAMAGLSITDARRAYDLLCARFAPEPPRGMTIRDSAVGGVPLRHHRPSSCRPGTVVFLHGGGFTIGSLDSHQGVAAGLAQGLGHDVAAVGYRLLPEASYADALSDCRDAIRALDPVAIVGDSAGGRLVIDIAQDMAEAPPLGLIYPVAGRPRAETLGPDAPLLSRADVLSAWAAIEPHAPASGPCPSARIEVLAVSRDPLTLPLEHAVAEWRALGARVGYRRATDMLHGCLHARESLPAMKTAWDEFCAALKAAIDG